MAKVVYCRGAGIHPVGTISLVLALSSLLCNAAERQPAQLPGKEPPWNRSLKILYAGQPGSDRERDFVAFLRVHFDVVQTGNARTFRETDTQGFDVTLLDGDWTEFHEPRPEVSESFSRPVITLGAPGALLCSSWRLKTGYL